MNIEGIVGSDNADSITGNSANNYLAGAGGNDAIVGGGGNDTAIFRGAPGDYAIDAGTVTDSVGGRDGADTLTGVNVLWFWNGDSGGGVDSVYQGLDPAADTNFDISEKILAGTVDGGSGTDRLTIEQSVHFSPWSFTSSGGADVAIVGGSRNTTALAIDQIILNTNGFAAPVMISGDFSGTGLGGGTGDNAAFVINGGGLADNFDASGISGGASVKLNGAGGNDTLKGGAGDDWLVGGTGADKMYGGDGNDTFFVDNGLDKVFENPGEGVADTVQSTISYVLPTNVENLTLLGAALNGTGNGSNNTLVGNALNNTLTGGDGADTLTGGGGKDIFRYTAASQGGDTITDFAAGDKLAFKSAAFHSLPVGVLAAGNFSGTGTPVDANDYFVFDGGTHILSYDSDGNGGAAPVAIATLTGVTTLHNTDIVITG